MGKLRERIGSHMQEEVSVQLEANKVLIGSCPFLFYMLPKVAISCVQVQRCTIPSHGEYARMIVCCIRGWTHKVKKVWE